MQNYNHIKAWLFLGIFSMILLHQSFPHLHHEHDHSDVPSHSHAQGTPAADHHHGHHGTEKQPTTPMGLFAILMDMHVHSNVSGEIVVITRNTLEIQTPPSIEVAVLTFDRFNYLLFDEDQIINPPVYPPPRLYYHSYISSPDLRGPPALG